MSNYYRDFTITYNPKPIPNKSFDWDFIHKDYDGPSDIRFGTAKSLWDAKFEIDDILEALKDNRMNFSEDFEDCPSVEERTSEFWEEEQVKTRYFDLHVRYSEKSGFSVFLNVENLEMWRKEDISKIAIDRTMIDISDIEFIDYVIEITANDYLNAVS